MVRAAFKGDGASFHFQLHRVGSPKWRNARTTGDVGTAINRLTKLRFPQGSEVSISGCPNFATAGKAGLTNLEKEVETDPPGLRPWRAVSSFLPS